MSRATRPVLRRRLPRPRHLRRLHQLPRLLGVVGLVVGAVVAAAGPAAAAEASSIDDSGWWSRANQDALLGSAVVFPDVSPGELLVEGTPEGATAVAALRATLPEGTGRPVLTLTATSAAGEDVPILLACPAGSDWSGAHGGAWSARPSPDCERASVQAFPEGDQWTFDLAALQSGDQLDIVLVPGVDDSGAGSTFRVVFERPTPASIEVHESNVEPDFEVPDFDSDDFGQGAGPPSDGGAGAGTPAPASGSSSAPTFSSPGPSTSEDLDTSPPQTALPDAEDDETATAPVISSSNPLPPAPLPAASSSGGDGRLLGLLVVLCSGALLYWSSQQELPARRSLSRFAVAAGGAPSSAAAHEPADALRRIPEEKRMGGLGRFRRVRDTPARRLGT